MASLLHLRTSQLLPLSADHTVGRAWGNRLQVEGDLVSAHHALIRWTGEGWELRDLGSRNGTWLANHRLAPGEGRLLGPGLSLAFGDPANRWRVEDLDPPAALGRGPQGQVERSEDGLLVLPNAARPEICVVQNIQGQWISEPADGSGGRIVQGTRRDGMSDLAMFTRWDIPPCDPTQPARMLNLLQRRPAIQQTDGWLHGLA